MTHAYDWSKLDEGWSVEGEKLQLAAAHGFKVWACWDIPVLEKVNGVPIGESTQAALDQLAKCRIVDNTPLFEAMDRMADECATVTELRPRDEYDWSRLDGSGWKAYAGNDVHSMLESERWNYYVGTGFLAFRLYGVVPTPEESWRVHNEAYALVAKCRRDWRDEVKQACEGLVPLLLWLGNRALLQWDDGEKVSTVDMMVARKYAVIAETTSCETLLRMSLIIERLKKLGWREA